MSQEYPGKERKMMDYIYRVDYLKYNDQLAIGSER